MPPRAGIRLKALNENHRAEKSFLTLCDSSSEKRVAEELAVCAGGVHLKEATLMIDFAPFSLEYSSHVYCCGCVRYSHTPVSKRQAEVYSLCSCMVHDT